MKSLSLYFFLALSCAGLCAVPSPVAAKQHKSSSKPTTFSSQDIIAMENKLINLINEVRLQHFLAPLKQWDELSLSARKHSKNMAAGTTQFGHDGFKGRVKAIRKRTPHIALAENVAYCYGKKDTLASAVTGWMKSPGHCKNILGDYNSTGIGIAYSKNGRCYMTQIFARCK